MPDAFSRLSPPAVEDPAALEGTDAAEATEAEAAENGTESDLPQVQLFTDGACRGNPGPGGWAFILRHPATGREREGSGGAAETTNNRMELQALIEGLQALRRRSDVEVVTDSTYVAKGAREWLPGWKANGWRRREGRSWKPVKNVEHWRRLDELLSRHVVRFTIIRGHSGHPENERCDELAVAAALACQADQSGQSGSPAASSGDEAEPFGTEPLDG